MRPAHVLLMSVTLALFARDAVADKKHHPGKSAPGSKGGVEYYKSPSTGKLIKVKHGGGYSNGAKPDKKANTREDAITTGIRGVGPALNNAGNAVNNYYHPKDHKTIVDRQVNDYWSYNVQPTDPEAKQLVAKQNAGLKEYLRESMGNPATYLRMSWGILGPISGGVTARAARAGR